MICSQHPSRTTNPFATCWTRPGAIPFHFPSDQSAERLVEKLAAQKWRGAIIGPHGIGKSTLLESLKPLLAGAGKQIHAIGLHDGQRYLPTGFWHVIRHAHEAKHELIIIDGYEQLAWLERFQLSRRCHRAGAGLMVTSHSPVRVPTLLQLAPDRRLVEQLVAELCAKVSNPVTRADVDASHAIHGSNVRDIFSELYDRHEVRRRESIALPAAS